MFNLSVTNTTGKDMNQQEKNNPKRPGAFKTTALLLAIFLAYGVVGEMDYQDEVAAQVLPAVVTAEVAQ